MAPKRSSKGNSSSSSSEVNRFPSSSVRYARKVYDEFAAEKEILLERSFDLGYLYKFIPNYLETLREWGWTDFLKLKLYTMPEVIRQFYFFGQDKIYNDKGEIMGYWDTPKLPTRLLNENIVITDSLVNEVVGINVTEGPKIIPRLNEEERMNFRKIVFKRENLEVFPKEVALISNLDVPERILHYIIGKRFFPRSRPTEFTDLDLFCMVRIMKKEPFDFGAFVVDKMHEGCVRTRSGKPFHCPYGKLITLLCENLFGATKLRGMRKVEDLGDDGLRDTINLMGFKTKGATRVSPGYESLDEQIAKFLSGEVGPKRRRGQKKYLIKGLPVEGLSYGTSSVGREEEEREQAHEENVGGNVTLEALMNTMVQGFARLESNQTEIRSTMGVMMTRMDGMDRRLTRIEETIQIVDENLTDIEEGRFGDDDAGPSGGGDDTMEP